MTKLDFLNSLKESLEPLSRDERKKFITYYEEIIEDYKENGLMEDEAILKLGNPQTIANDILSEQDVDYIKTHKPGNRVLNTVLLILGFPLWGSLLLALVLIIFAANILVWCIPFTTGVTSAALLFASIISIIGTPLIILDSFNEGIRILGTGIMQLGVGVILIGISILLAYLTVFLSRKFIMTTKVLIMKICKRFKRKVVRI